MAWTRAVGSGSAALKTALAPRTRGGPARQDAGSVKAWVSLASSWGAAPKGSAAGGARAEKARAGSCGEESAAVAG